MKLKDSKYFKGALSLGIGVVLLTTAVFANYENANGYNVCKETLKKIAYAENYSVDATFGIRLDDVQISRVMKSYKLNVGGNPSEISETTEEDFDNTVKFFKWVYQDDLAVNIHRYSADEPLEGYVYNGRGKSESFVNKLAESKETGDKIINFAETIADTMVGDLKNSVVLASDENGITKYNINLSSEQMPSYISAGVAMVSSMIKSENTMHDYEEMGNPLRKLFASGDPYVRDVGITISVDDSGNPVQLTGSINFIGYDEYNAEHTLTVDLSVDAYDFGTTEIERVSDKELEAFDDYRTSKRVFYDAQAETLETTYEEAE